MDPCRVFAGNASRKLASAICEKLKVPLGDAEVSSFEDGVAQARFQELWAEWQRSSRGIQEALHGISQLTQQAGTNYADTEQGIASSFGR